MGGRRALGRGARTKSATTAAAKRRRRRIGVLLLLLHNETVLEDAKGGCRTLGKPKWME